MISPEEQRRVQARAAEIAAELSDATGAGAHCKNAARIRIRQEFGHETGPFIIALARELRDVHGCHWFSRCLARYHPEAFQSLDDSQVEALGQGIDSKDPADSYARILVGPAWVRGLVSDDLILRRARSEDLWWRRAALVSTVALNTRGDGGRRRRHGRQRPVVGAAGAVVA